MSPASGAVRSCALDDRVHWWLDQATGVVDVRAVLRLWEKCLEGADDESRIMCWYTAT